MHIDEQGIAEGVRQIPSPNFDERPEGSQVELLVVHAISLPPGEFGGEAVIELFTNRLDPQAHLAYRDLRDLRVSAHFFVRRNGKILQFVPCGKRAWHAGESTFRGRPRCNDFSIGVELEGSDDVPFADAQYRSLAALIRSLRQTYPISAIAGHCDISPMRKTDPGPFFDWERCLVLVGEPRLQRA